MVILAVAALALTVVDAALPPPMRIAVLLAILFSAGVSLLGVGPDLTRDARRTLRLGVAVIVFWVVQIANPNVPNLGTGFAGLRLSTFLWIGLLLGAGLAARHGPGFVLQLTALLLTISLGLALTLHFLAPSVEQGISRSANVATATFQGDYRLAGLFSGPFHASLAGVMLTILGTNALLQGSASRKNAFMMCVIGIASVLTAQVRTGFVALAVAVVFLIIGRGPTLRRGRLLARSALLAASLSIAYVAYTRSTVVSSLGASTVDTRFTGRFTSYREGLRLFGEQPLIGYGSGSAGDSLADAFFGAVHITGHNMFLKIAVEGGVVGLMLVVLLCMSLWRQMSRVRSATSQAGRALLIAFLVMGLTGSIIEALPVSLWLCLILGAALIGPVDDPQEPEISYLRHEDVHHDDRRPNQPARGGNRALTSD
jgi:O-antigen ligase